MQSCDLEVAEKKLQRKGPSRDRGGAERKGSKNLGAIAHLVERLPCTQEVVGSSPTGSTKKDKGGELRARGSGVEAERKDEERQRSRDPKYLRVLDI